MNISVNRTAGRLLLPVAAAVLLAGVSLEAGAYGSKGRIAFQTGKDLTSFHFRLETLDNPAAPREDWTWGASTLGDQSFEVNKGCTIEPIGDDLVDIRGYRGTGSGRLGYVPTSLGIYDGPQGTACGRISDVKEEAIGFAVGTSEYLGEGNAFDRLELDLEVKGDVTLELVISFDGAERTYTLKAGSAVVNQSDEGAEFDSTNADTPFYCRAASDSGPDSGPSDNCRWIINDVGQSFKITPRLGEFSVEGGGDYSGTEIALNRTFIYLTRADGILDCGDSRDAVDSAAGISCAVTRLDAPEETCIPVPYVFRTDVASDGTQSCIFEADMGSQQLVANIFASYGLEGQEETSDLSALDEWLPRPLSEIHFSINGTPYYDIPPCLGLTLTGIDLESEKRVGPVQIPEIYLEEEGGGVDGDYDRIEENNTIEFACAFMRREVFETVNGVNYTRVDEGIQFWGDPQLSRPGAGSGL